MIPEDKIYSLLRDTFRGNEFRPSQKEIITRTLEGGHSLVLMPTGMGKSLCYQLPALVFDGLTVVISPLIALMKDQVDRLKSLGIDASFVNSSLSRAEREGRYADIKRGRYRLLYVSPERFRKEGFIEAVSARKVSLLALDEAHCVSQWGNDFRPDYSRIGGFRELIGSPVTVALTATATPDVQNDIIEKTGLKREDVRIFNEGICRPNLSLEVFDAIDEEEKYGIILEQLKGFKGTAVIYFTLIKSIERFASFLDMKRVMYSVYHGRLLPEKRKRIQKEFMESGGILMLATNAFGMGIDKPDIRMIIHAEVPDSIESYYQEIGRGGRDGRDTRCILIYGQDDLAVQISYLQWKNPDAVFIKTVYDMLRSMGGHVNSFDYGDLQEKVVHKNRDDHRLHTVLHLFDLYGVTEGAIGMKNLRLAGGLPGELVSGPFIREKMERDRQRLIEMVNYAKSTGCRRELIYKYFGLDFTGCGNCDNCRVK